MPVQPAIKGSKTFQGPGGGGGGGGGATLAIYASGTQTIGPSDTVTAALDTIYDDHSAGFMHADLVDNAIVFDTAGLYLVNFIAGIIETDLLHIYGVTAFVGNTTHPETVASWVQLAAIAPDGYQLASLRGCAPLRFSAGGGMVLILQNLDPTNTVNTVAPPDGGHAPAFLRATRLGD